ncbi:MAG: class I SAM-dependent methyltransferase, partial [Thermoleophilaceae bacterium]
DVRTLADETIADPGGDLRDLRDYLGSDYDLQRLRGHMGLIAEEWRRIGDEAAFYRNSQAYLYDLTVFALSGTKEPYLEVLRRLVPPPAHVLDYGCGIGSDGIRLLESGYRVTFADFDNPSTRYLRWRLERRGLRADVVDLDRDDVPTGLDAAFAFDVIEHVPDPYEMLECLERSARLVVVNFLAEGDDHAEVHRSLPVRRLVLRAAMRRLRHYGLYHDRSHLVAYEPRRAPLRSLPVLAAGRWRTR